MPAQNHPWRWIPPLYFAQGLPFVAAMALSVVLYKRLEVSNTAIAFYTSWLYLPWVIKPLWSPLVDLLGTRRRWVLLLQTLMGAGFAVIGMTLPLDDFFRYSLAAFWLLAFASATHDIAADGFYILALEEHQQAAFSGVRSTFYRLASIAGQGLLVMLAGFLEETTGNVRLAWSSAFYLLAALFLLNALWLSRALPQPGADARRTLDGPRGALAEFFATFADFFRKPGIVPALAFLLFYRFAEAQLVKLAAPFLLDGRDAGGLGLDTAEVGAVYGTVGVIALTLGGILGGVAASRQGLKFWLWPMALAINLPNAVYLLLAWGQPEGLWLVNLAVAAEQFGYGFGFSAYVLYMIYIARGGSSTAHYAICTGFMALGMMLPGLFAGALQEWLGYHDFFAWVLIATLPSFLVTRLIPLDAGFGRRPGADERH
jgi:PAT family beta-lactamase induction signal transducer AmpG